MTRRSHLFFAASIAGLSLVATSCNREQRINEGKYHRTDGVLRLLVAASHAYFDRNGHYPASLNDLQMFIAEDWEYHEIVSISKHELQSLRPLLLECKDGWGMDFVLCKRMFYGDLLLCSAGADRVYGSDDDRCRTLWYNPVYETRAPESEGATETPESSHQ